MLTLPRLIFETLVAAACAACSNWLTVLALAQVEEDRAKFLKDQEEFKRSHRASWEIDVKEKQRLIALAADKEAFEEAIKTRRVAEFAALQVWRSYYHRPAATDSMACLQLHLEHTCQQQPAQSQLGHSFLCRLHA